MNPTDKQAQGLYRLCYRLTNAIYPQWQYRNIELVKALWINSFRGVVTPSAKQLLGYR